MTKASTTTKTELDALTLDELRALADRLERQANTTKVPGGISRERAHALFDESRAAIKKANAGALDEIVSRLTKAQPGATISFPSGAGDLYAVSDEFAAAVHARIDATPLYVGWGSIAWETEADRQAARERVVNANLQASSEARRVRALIGPREEEERQRELEEEHQRIQARREERLREDQEHTGRVLREREEQQRQFEEQRRLLQKGKS
jgi:hypothetical protein